MRGFIAFLEKELREIFRTWRIWVLPGIVLFFALSGPPLAAVTPQLIETLVPAEGTGVIIQVPDPTYVDAYLQWTGNLSEVVLIALIIIMGGMISSERKQGTAILVLTKPLSRTAFVLAKFVSNVKLLSGPVMVGALLTWGLTHAVFGEAPMGDLAAATGAWLLLGILFIAVMELLSALLDSQAGAAGLGFVFYIALSISTLWGPAVRYSPAGLVGAPTKLVTGEAIELLWPVWTTVALTVLCVGAAVAVFRRREL